MIKFPKGWDESKRNAIIEKIGKDEIKKYEDEFKRIYVFEYKDTPFVFRGIKFSEWNDIISSISYTDNTTQQMIENELNMKICKLAVLYNYSQLEFMPGLIIGIANQILSESGFDAVGEGKAIEF